MACVDVERPRNEIGQQVELQLGEFELTPRYVHRAGTMVDLDGVRKGFRGAADSALSAMYPGMASDSGEGANTRWTSEDVWRTETGTYP